MGRVPDVTSNREHDDSVVRIFTCFRGEGRSLRASSPFGSHAIFILGEIYLGLAQDLGASRERIGAGAR